jgi:hypothetical protein
MRDRTVTVRLRQCLSAALVVAALGSASGRARAQSTEPDPGPPSGNIAKGVTGGAALGAELVMLGESAFRLRPAWLYLVGGGAGAIAGGYLGYRIGDGKSNRPPSFLLAGGIALIIPTIMGVLTATEYAPPESFRPEPPSDDEVPEARAPIELELPNVGLAQAFSREELVLFRAQQVTELHLSLLRGAF